MILPCSATQSADPIAVAEEIRPEVRSKAQPTNGGVIRVVFVGVRPEPSPILVPLVQGTIPLAPFDVIPARAEPMDALAFEESWKPKARVPLVVRARRTPWSEAEFDY